MQKPDKTKKKEQLDFLSDEFDPLTALKSSSDQVRLPVPDAKVFNNLDEYALKSFPSKKSDQATSSGKQSDLDLLRRQNEIRERMKEKIVQLDAKKKPRKREDNQPRTILTPLSKSDGNRLSLEKFLNKRLRIFIRRRRKSKHGCEQYACVFGQLMFYDKHWNLILSDVNETMQYVDQVSDESLTNVEKNEDFLKNDFTLSTGLISSLDNRRLLINVNDEDKSVNIAIRERHFKRLFVRGDNIIYISHV